MSDFWQQVQQQEQEQWEEMLKRDPGYEKWLNELNRQMNSGFQSTTDTTNSEEIMI